MPRRQTRTVSSLIKSLTIDVMQAVIIEMGNNPDAIIRKGRRAEYEVLIRRYHNANPDIDMHAFVDQVILSTEGWNELEEEFDEVFCAKEKAMAILVCILWEESPLDLTRLGDRFQRINHTYSWDDSYKDLLGSFSDFLRNNHRFTVLDPEKPVFSVCLAAEYDQPHNGDHCLDMAGDDSDVDVVVVDDDDQEDDDVELVRARAREREYNHGGEVQKTYKELQFRMAPNASSQPVTSKFERMDMDEMVCGAFTRMINALKEKDTLLMLFQDVDLPAYRLKIKTPIHFGDILRRIKKRRYKRVRNIQKEILMLFNNCYTFYGQPNPNIKDDFSTWAQTLQDELYQYMQTLHDNLVAYGYIASSSHSQHKKRKKEKESSKTDKQRSKKKHNSNSNNNNPRNSVVDNDDSTDGTSSDEMHTTTTTTTGKKSPSKKDKKSSKKDKKRNKNGDHCIDLTGDDSDVDVAVVVDDDQEDDDVEPDMTNMKGDSEHEYNDGECVWAKYADSPWWPGQIELPPKKKRGRKTYVCHAGQIELPKHHTITVRWFGDFGVQTSAVQKRFVTPWDPDEIARVYVEVDDEDITCFQESVDECNTVYMQLCSSRRFRKTERNDASAALGHHDAEVQKKENDGGDCDGGKDVMHDTPINSIATTALVPLSSHSNSNVTSTHTSSVDPQKRSHGVEEEANAATTVPFAAQQNTTTTLEQSHQPPPVKKRKLNIDTDQACEALCELPY